MAPEHDPSMALCTQKKINFRLWYYKLTIYFFPFGISISDHFTGLLAGGYHFES